ncbi:hypothetical protein OQA88_10716 [Cercophora sp. LCS_1]
MTAQEKPLPDPSESDLSTLTAAQDATPQSEPPPDLPPIYSIHSTWSKRLIVLCASLSAFFSPLTAQIYLPALNVIAEDFSVSSAQINLTVTTYMIFQGLTPMFIGGFADSAGRRPAYVVCFVIYIAANIGLALSKNYASLLVVRCLQSAGSSSTIALCQAVVADIITSADRGQYIGITAIPVILAPSLGPVLGGVLTQYLGWRWIFWFLAIAAALNLLGMLFFFPETCRRIVGDGSAKAHPIYRTFWQMVRNRKGEGETRLQRSGSTASKAPVLRIKPPNPLDSLKLLLHKELAILLAYSAVVFAGFYAITTAMPAHLANLYGYDGLRIGLLYLPCAGGSLFVTAVMGPLINFNYRRHAAKIGVAVDKTRQTDLSEFPVERARLEVGMPLMVLTAAVTVAWGWAIQFKAHIAVLCVLQFLTGLGLAGFNQTVNVLIVDIYPGKAGAAVAANNLTRCLVGAAATALIVPMERGMGAGGAYTLIGGLFVIFAPTLVMVMRRGIRWRRELREREDKAKAAQAAN